MQVECKHPLATVPRSVIMVLWEWARYGLVIWSGSPCSCTTSGNCSYQFSLSPEAFLLPRLTHGAQGLFSSAMREARA